MYLIYGKDDCPYCDKAKELLDFLGYDYDYVGVDKDNYTLMWFKGCGYKTVPQVFLGDTHIGGYTELEAYLR